ncbi:MAG: SDR family oxidoreductase [Gammaproteobacteria bacterium]|nr:SDR family oxidoreductase [Gammaproteobacteria bacterium]
MTIAIAAATGQLGRLVVRALQEKHPVADIVALARTPARAAELGVAVRAADYARPETLGPALEGVGTLLLISSSEFGQRAAQHRNVIAAARTAGVERIVYTSLLHAERSPLNLAPEHRESEQALRASGVPYTILRNGWYTENYAGSIPGAVAGEAFLGAAGEGRISSAARRDFADAAVAALISAGHEGKTYELAGDDAYTLAELAAEISRQVGRPIPYRNLPESDYARALAGFGLPASLANAIASWDVCASTGALFDDSRQLSRLIGRPTTPLSVSVAAAL